ncbi:methionine--tRNA ligase [Candidatus Woesearchaeota archaeon]|nr:methionine--tRNA ligase [Candidatus Woesearchaeota archaeon]
MAKKAVPKASTKKPAKKSSIIITKQIKQISKKNPHAASLIPQCKPTLVKPAKLSGKIVVTAALPYANGPIHLGHMVEYIQADIYSRFLKLAGKEVIYCCADDTHGTPIEINAMKEGIAPEQLIDRYHREHQQDFSDFLVAFDNFYSTNSPENKKYAEYFFKKLQEAGLLYQKDVELTYCEKCSRFLPDRYVKGRCPKCKTDDQYGDVCEKCNATYTTTDLVDPYCTICGTTPVRKLSRHYFFKLSACSDALKNWISNHPKLQKEVKHYVLNWVNEGLKDWCISRDGPYFGFRIPGEDDKYFYVWLDAPIGYIASTTNYTARHKQDIDDYWKRGSVIHFIGKDIIYFHLLFWPAELMVTGFTLPENIIVHGHLTVNGEKMSKSRGTFITAREYLKLLPPEYLRFYYAANLSHTMSDIDLNFDDFRNKVNNELVADLANFTYRTLSFVNKNFDSRVTSFSPKFAEKLGQGLPRLFQAIRAAYEDVNFREAVKLILEASSLGNKVFQENEPWKLVKTDKAKAQEVVSFCASLIKDLSIAVAPILPNFSTQVQQQITVRDLSWKDVGVPLKDHTIGEAKIVLRKLEGEIDRLKPGPSGEADPFAKVDLRVGKILEVKKHPDAEKLFVEVVDLGKLGKRIIVSGLAQYYHPDELVGKHVVIVANLQPAKLRGVERQGMLLAGEDAAGNVGVLEAPQSDSGSQVYVEGILSKPLPQIIIKEFEQVHINIESNVAVYKGKSLKTEFEEIVCDRIERGNVH